MVKYGRIIIYNMNRGVDNLGYKEKIIEMVEEINDVKFLEFLYGMLVSFKKKWGI